MALGRWRWKTPDLRGLGPGERFLSLLWMDPEKQYTRLASNLVVVVDTFNPSTWRQADLWVQACLVYRTSFRIARPTQRKPVSDKTKQKDWPVDSICTWVHTHSQCIDWRWGGKFKSSVVDMVDMGMMCKWTPICRPVEGAPLLSVLSASILVSRPAWVIQQWWILTIWFPKTPCHRLTETVLYPLPFRRSSFCLVTRTLYILFVPSPLGLFCLLLVPFSLWCLPTHTHKYLESYCPCERMWYLSFWIQFKSPNVIPFLILLRVSTTFSLLVHLFMSTKAGSAH